MEPTTPKEAAGVLAQNLAPIVTELANHALTALESLPNTPPPFGGTAHELCDLCTKVRDAATELETAKNALFQLSSRGG